MKEVMHNSNNIKDEDIEKVINKAKLLLVNSKKELLLGYCDKTYQFIGGRLDEGESLKEGLKREIIEETGMDVDTETLEPIYIAKYRYKKDKGVDLNNEIITTFFYLESDIECDRSKTSFDHYEEKGNFKVKRVKLPQIELLLLKENTFSEHTKTITKEMIETLKEIKLIE